MRLDLRAACAALVAVRQLSVLWWWPVAQPSVYYICVTPFGSACIARSLQSLYMPAAAATPVRAQRSHLGCSQSHTVATRHRRVPARLLFPLRVPSLHSYTDGNTLALMRYVALTSSHLS